MLWWGRWSAPFCPSLRAWSRAPSLWGISADELREPVDSQSGAFSVLWDRRGTDKFRTHLPTETVGNGTWLGHWAPASDSPSRVVLPSVGHFEFLAPCLWCTVSGRTLGLSYCAVHRWRPPPLLITAFRAFSLGAHFKPVCGRSSQMWLCSSLLVMLLFQN